jgi:hypothetical protein
MYKSICTTHVSLQANLLMLSPLLRGHLSYKTIFSLGRCGHDLDRMVVGFTTTYAISTYHH